MYKPGDKVKLKPDGKATAGILVKYPDKVYVVESFKNYTLSFTEESWHDSKTPGFLDRFRWNHGFFEKVEKAAPVEHIRPFKEGDLFVAKDKHKEKTNVHCILVRSVLSGGRVMAHMKTHTGTIYNTVAASELHDMVYKSGNYRAVLKPRGFIKMDNKSTVVLIQDEGTGAVVAKQRAIHIPKYDPGDVAKFYKYNTGEGSDTPPTIQEGDIQGCYAQNCIVDGVNIWYEIWCEKDECYVEVLEEDIISVTEIADVIAAGNK